VEKRRIIQGNVVAWEGTWEAATTCPKQEAKLPLVMVIDFNPEGKVKSLSSYYDSAHFQCSLSGRSGLAHAAQRDAGALRYEPVITGALAGSSFCRIARYSSVTSISLAP
jgi:hypothetical protein